MIPQGYKQTEIGVIPQDWNVHTLEMLYNITSSKRVFQSQWRKSGIPFYRAREIAVMSEGKSAPEDLYIDADLYNQYTRQYGSIKKDDVLITGVGTLGKVYVVKESDKFYFKDGNIIWLQFKDGFSSQYLKHQYDMPVLINQVFGNAGGSTVATYTITNAKSTKVPVPPLDEQKRIAEALSDVDSMISSLEKLIAKKKAVKQGTMQELLTGKKRLPGFTGEWVSGKWKDVLGCFSSGATPYRGNSEFYKGTIKWVSSGELNYNYITDTLEHISYDAQTITNLTLHPAGTFLMAITGLEAAGTRGSCAILGTAATTNQSCMAIYGTEKMSTEYLFHYYVQNGDELAIQYCQGTKQQSYTAAIVKELPIYYPEDVAEQNVIASILSDMDKEIETLEQKLAKNRQIKQGMMQQLLTGKIRLV